MNEPLSPLAASPGTPAGGSGTTGPASGGSPGQPAPHPGAGLASGLASGLNAPPTGGKGYRGGRGPDKKPRAKPAAPPVASPGLARPPRAPVADLRPLGDDEGAAPGEVPSGPRFVIPPEIVKALGRELAAGRNNQNVGRLRSAAVAAAVEPARAALVVDSVKMSDERLDMVATLTPLALQEIGADEHVSPLTALIAILGIGELAVWRAIQVFREEGQNRAPTPPATP